MVGSLEVIMDMQENERQVKSKQRVADHGEVYTSAREVNAMLDMVKQETERIESRFLEPACGDGNFLIEVLRRKLEIVKKRYEKNQIEYERYSILALSSIYGIDILEDNTVACRNRLFAFFKNEYEDIYKSDVKEDFLKSAQYILSKNIVWGDALTLHSVCGKKEPIIFCEWSPVNGSMIKRRDFSFHELLFQSENNAMPLFSDAGEDVFIPEPVKEYPLIHFMRLYDAE